MRQSSNLLVSLTFVLLSFLASAQNPEALVFTDASLLPVIGKGFEDTENRYERLPAYLKEITRQPVWQLSTNCSGLAIRFRSNSGTIAARWEVTGDVVMNHFTPTGIKGLDLYCMKDGEWQFVNSARPTGKSTQAVIISNMKKEDREYMLYLPLYDGLANLEIGIDAGSDIGNPYIDSPKRNKPAVFYGTSITQGGCATRAGMSYTNILSRKLDREIINLGFSGNGKLDLEIAEAMTKIDASCYVIDCLPNVTIEIMNEKYIPFIEILRKAKPEVPIFLIENIHYTHMSFDEKVAATIDEKNQLLEKIWKELKKNDKEIYYLKSDGLIGDDLEGTVDGVHLTDLGFLRMSETLYPKLKKIIR